MAINASLLAPMEKLAFGGTRAMLRRSPRIFADLGLRLNPVHCRCISLLREKAFVNGSWIDAKSSKTFSVTNPCNGKVLAVVPDCDASDAEKAIDAAQHAFLSWRDITAKERGSLLLAWSMKMMEQQEELAKIMTAEQGKPLTESRGEIAYAASFLQWFAEEGRRILGDVIPSPYKDRQMFAMKFPIGVAGLITPWNFPSAMITRKAGAALAAGCTCVVKPAEDTPLSALALAAIAEEVGVPRGVFNVVTGSRETTPEIGKLLCEHPNVGVLSFTGSTEVGKILYKQCASGVKRLALELGGNAPFIVFNSASVSKAVQSAMASKFRNMGQTCVCANRFLVQEGIHDEFVSRLKEAMVKELVLGDGLNSGVTQGPLVNQQQINRIDELVRDAVSRGAKLVMGGKKAEDLGPLYFEPTLLVDVKTEMPCFQEEQFGPVVTIVKFKTEEEALKIANKSRRGLSGYIFSQDIKQVFRVVKKLEVGMLGVNETLLSSCEAPFGGVKESGIGREGSHFGIEEYLEVKYVCIGDLA